MEIDNLKNLTFCNYLNNYYASLILVNQKINDYMKIGTLQEQLD
jgi:hypothetical protein